MVFLRCLLFASFTCAAALTNYEKYHYKRQTTDLRSPCPAINTLANHGFINRDGRGTTLEQLRQASMDVYNIDIFLAQLFTTGGNLVVQNDTLSGIFTQTVDLSAFDKHDAIEHDGSLTRMDFSQGDSTTFQPDMLQQLLDDSITDYLDFNSLGKSRARRERDMAARGLPPLDGKGDFIAYGESSLILKTFGKGTEQATKVDVETFFREERLPDGYEKPVDPTTIPGTVALAGEIRAASSFWHMFSRRSQRRKR